MGERILFLYHKTGGGHISAARALSESILSRHGIESETFLLDGLPVDKKFERFLLEDMYRISVNYFQPAYKLMYDISTIPAFIDLENKIMVAHTAEHIAMAVREKGITRIVVLHFLLIGPAYAALKLCGLNLPVLTVVLDPFTAHPLWYARKNVPTVVFSERAKAAMVEYGWDPSYVTILPIIINSKFERRLSDGEKDVLKDEIGLAKGKKTVLIAGGGEGLPFGDMILRSLVRKLDANFIIVCGKSRPLLRECIIVKKRHRKKVVKVFGFTRKMYELINVADIVIAKAGPATMMEILMMGKPMIASTYIRGQEQGNVDFLVENGLGWYTPEPHLIRKRVQEVLDHPDRHSDLLSRIESMKLRSGTDEIADFILSLPRPEHARGTDRP